MGLGGFGGGMVVGEDGKEERGAEWELACCESVSLLSRVVVELSVLFC